MIRLHFLFLILLFIFTSCNNNNSWLKAVKNQDQEFELLRGKAVSFLNSQPDSALLFADSALLIARNKGINDTSLISLLFLKADAFVNRGLSDSVTPVLLKARYIAISASDTAYIAESSRRMGLFLRNQEQSLLAEGYALEALHLFEKLEDKNSIGNACDLYGNLLSDMGNYLRAHEYLMKSYNIFKQMGNIKALGIASMNIGLNLKLMGNMEEATRYSRASCEYIAQVHDTASLKVAYNNLGIVLRTAKPDSAMYYYRKALELNRESSPMNSVITRFNIANLYLDKKDVALALQEFNTVLGLCRQNQLSGGIARVYHAFGEIYILTRDFPRADYYLHRSIKLADSLGLRSLSPDFNKTLLQSYKDQGRMAEYFRLSNRVMAQRDSMIGKDKEAAITYIAQYQQAEKKELENAYLNVVLKNKENKLLLSKIIISVVVFASILLVFLLIRILRLYKERSKAYNLLIKLYHEERAQREAQAEAMLNINDNSSQGDTQADERQLLIKQLLQYYKSEKPYLNPKLRVEDLAETLSTSRKAIASALSQYNNSNFVSFTNTYRVEHAIMLMESDEYRNYKTAAVAADAGFGSTQSFYRIFQQFTGVMPNYYRKNQSKPDIESAA
jgi:AraC-like DNA-binding protein